MKHLDDIEARLKAATPGPWKMDDADQVVRAADRGIIYDQSGDSPGDWPDGNAELITHIPDDLTRTTNALRAVLELHKPEPIPDGMVIAPYCSECTSPIDGGPELHPCRTVRAITDALQGEQ